MAPWSVTRRNALQSVGCGFGALAFSGLSQSCLRASGNAPLVEKTPIIIPKAKRVIFLFMQGGPSQVDSFDEKPALEKHDGKQMPFDDARVRQALNLAINKQAIIDSVFQGAGEPAKNPIPPTIWSYNDAVKDYPHDPEAAKKLLAEAGVSGLKTKLWAMPVSRPYNPNAKRMAELIQADWKAVGVDAEIVSYEWGEYLKRSQAGEHETVLLGWTGDNGDPDNFLFALLSCEAAKAGNNRARWCNQEFNELIVKAQQANDPAERTRLYEQAQLVFKREAPWVTIAHSVVYQPVRKEVVDFKIDPFGKNIFYGVDLKG